MVTTSENEEVSPAPLARRLIAEAVTGPESWSPDWCAEDLAMVPSGSARLAVTQAVAVAALAIYRLAEFEARPPADVLAEMWPDHPTSSEADRDIAARIVERDR